MNTAAAWTSYRDGRTVMHTLNLDAGVRYFIQKARGLYLIDRAVGNGIALRLAEAVTLKAAKEWVALELAKVEQPIVDPKALELQKLNTEHAAKVAKLEREYALKAALPGEPWYVTDSLSMGFPGASYKAEGVRGAIEILKQFTVVPFTEHRNGFTRLVPMHCVPEDKRDTHAAQWALSVYVQDMFEGHTGHMVTAKVNFFARVEGVPTGVIKITVDMKGPGYIGNFQALGGSCNWEGRHRNRVAPGSARPNALLCGLADKRIPWASGGHESANNEYLFHTGEEGKDVAATDLGHALAQLVNLSARVDAEVALHNQGKH